MNAADVAKKLKAKGQLMILSKVGAQIFEPVSGSISFATPQTFPVYGITANYSSIRFPALGNDPGTMILSGDKKALIEVVAGGTPVPSDTLTIMGKVWTVIAVDALAPAGVDLMYTCQVRL